MKLCEYCGRENSDEAVQCSECGTDVFKSTAPSDSPPLPTPNPERRTPGQLKSVATLNRDEAVKLLEFLSSEQIPGEIQTVTLEGGLETSEVLVENSLYAAACDGAERWLANVCAEEDKRSARRCPNCRSSNLEPVEHDKLQYVLQCKDCACLITYLSHE